MSKVFFVTYGGGHVNIIRHIYRALIHQNIKPTILALTSSVKTLDKEKIPYKKISDYLDLFDYKDQILKFGNYLGPEFYDKNSELDYFDIISYLGFSIYDLLVEEDGFENALKKFRSEGHKIFNPVNTMEKILKYEKPNVLVLTSSMRMEKAAGFMGNKMNIPVVRILDTIGDDDIVPYECKICVMNKKAKENVLINNRIDPKKVIVTGQPDYEESLKIEEQVLNKIRKNLELDKYEKIITYLSQPRMKETELIIGKLNEIAVSSKNNLVIIKLHPNENIEEYSEFIEKKASNLILVKDEELIYYIKIADVVLTKHSTGALLGIFMDKPIIVINVFNSEFFPDYSKYGVAVCVRDLNVLETIIEILFDSESKLNKKLKVGRKKLKNTENATLNVVEVIKQANLNGK